MKIHPTKFSGCFIIEPKILTDQRGYFMESFNQRAFEQATGSAVHFVQDNQSFSSRGVLRGLHYQVGDAAQAKLVRVIDGEVLDVVVDIRPGSETFGQQLSVILSGENQRQLFIPRGFAHGFVVLSNTATFFYKCDNFYDREAESGIFYGDPELNIDWMLPQNELIVSEKDQQLPGLANAEKVW